MNKTMQLVFIFSFLISISFAQDYRTIQIETLEEAIIPGEEIYVNVDYINGENNSVLIFFVFTSLYSIGLCSLFVSRWLGLSIFKRSANRYALPEKQPL